MRNSRQIFTALALASLSLGATAPSSPIADAAMRRDIAAVRALIAKRADVNAPQGDGMTALHWAAKHGDVDIATLLIRAKASLSATTRNGMYTPLHIASEAGAAPVVAALLKAGADAEATTATGVSPLHLAALSGSSAAITALVNRGADPNAREPEWGQTPLMIAAARGRTSAVTVLLQHGANPAITARVVDLLARSADDQKARARRNQVLRAGRKAQGADSQATWRPDTRLVQEAVRASQQVVKNPNAVVAEAEPEVYQGTNTGGDEDFAGFTAMVGFQGGLTALHLAVREGQTEAVRALLDAKADINQVTPADKTSPLLLATINGHYDLAKLLLERGADPNVASDAGATPLYAVINKEWAPTSRTPQPAFHLRQQATYLELMEALLKAKADPNTRLKRSLWYTTYNRDNLRVDFSGATPFWRAAYATDLAAMKLLLAHGADPKVATIRGPVRQRRGGGGPGGADTPDPSLLPPVPEGGPGIYPIHAASGTGYGQGYAANDHRHAPESWLATVKFLVGELGADVNARDFNGYTPLHNAAARGDNEMITYLVSKGADVTAVARTGQTTADMANGPVQRISPFLDTVALLERLGSKNNHRCVSC